ncbi:hypothetical protein [Streptomyces sp. NPDC057702]|uniref:hypothetical protein n=1 Tax=unclassified Streptomyces TaxID=2593676 RepID=UPI0036BCD91A
MTGAAVVAAALACAVTPAQARETTTPIQNGKAEFCLTKPAAKRLAEAKIRLAATGGAKLTGKQHQCVSFPLTEGTRDYAKLKGGVTFRDRDDRLDLTKIHNYVNKTPHTQVSASVNRAKARQVDFLTYSIKRENAQTTPKQIKAVDVRTALTADGEKLLKKTFGKSPLRAGEHAFVLNAVADLPQGAPDLLAALLGSLG